MKGQLGLGFPKLTYFAGSNVPGLPYFPSPRDLEAFSGLGVFRVGTSKLVASQHESPCLIAIGLDLYTLTFWLKSSRVFRTTSTKSGKLFAEGSLQQPRHTAQKAGRHSFPFERGLCPKVS